MGPVDYQVLRVLSYGVALSALPTTLQYHAPGTFKGLPIQLREIDTAALAQWSSHWHSFQFTHGGWDWQRIATYYQTLFDDRFEVAVWCGPVLCGLAAGMYRNGCVEISNIEGSPDKQHPLRGAVRYAVVEAARAYASALGASEVRLNHPRAALLTIYQQMGFTMHGWHPYCWMKVP